MFIAPEATVARPTKTDSKVSNKAFLSAHRYMSREECLSHLDVNLVRLGLDPDEHVRASPSVVRADLRGGPEEEHVAKMFRPFLQRREGFHNRAPYDAAHLPRIDLEVGVNIRQNLSVTWQPTGWDEVQNTSDWKYWHRSNVYMDRPSNELLFIREFGNLRYLANNEVWRMPYSLDINRLLVQATAAAIEELKTRLSYCFEIRMTHDLFLTWSKEIEGSGQEREVVSGWFIECPEVRDEYEDRAVLAGWEALHGVPVQEVLKALSDALPTRPSGRAPSLNYTIAKASKALRESGFGVGAAAITGLHSLLAKYEPERIPAPIRNVV